MYSLLKKNRAFFIPYFIFLLIGGVVLLLYNKISISLYINYYHSPAADFIFKNVTLIGLGYTIIPVVLILLFIRFRYALISLTAFFLAVIINDSLKSIFHTPRPVTVFSQMHQTLYLVPNVEIDAWNSFPSGHTATGFCIFCVLALYAKNNFTKATCFAVAFLIAYSRMYLSEHFLIDVYAASIIGMVSALVIYKWMMSEKMFTKFGGIDKPLIRTKKRNT